MQYEGNIIRPPSEANSIILQVTAGCSYNKCTFCGAYKDKPFRIRSNNIADDIDFAALHCRSQSKVFLADGDALILPYDKLAPLFQQIQCKLPWVNRISLYANCRAIRSKTDQELYHLKQLGLDRVYLGLESGDDRVLHQIEKGETARSMIEAADKIRQCSLFFSVTALLGVAGVALAQEHAIATGQVLTRMSPNQIALLSVIPLPGTRFFDEIATGKRILPDAYSLLQEMKTIIQFIELDHVQFHANHASNYLHVSGRLQKDKKKILARIEAALKGSIPLVPEEWRAL